MTPADELRTAARKLNSGMLIVRADLDPLLARWMADEARRISCASSPAGQEIVGRNALAVARAILGTQETT